MASRFAKLVLLWIMLLSIITIKSQPNIYADSSDTSCTESDECEDNCDGWEGNAEDINSDGTCKHCSNCKGSNCKYTCKCPTQSECEEILIIGGIVGGVLFILAGCGSCAALYYFCFVEKHGNKTNKTNNPTPKQPVTITTQQPVTNPNTVQMVQPNNGQPPQDGLPAYEAAMN